MVTAPRLLHKPEHDADPAKLPREITRDGVIFEYGFPYRKRDTKREFRIYIKHTRKPGDKEVHAFSVDQEGYESATYSNPNVLIEDIEWREK